MITTKYVRDHISDIRESLKKRGSKFPIDELLELDENWRKMTTELQELQAKRNKASLEISTLKKKGEDVRGHIAALGELKAQIEQLEAALPSYDEKINNLLWNLPNVMHGSVPAGKDDNENPVLKTWGKTREAKSVQNHEDLLLDMDLLEIERAAKVSGARFFYLKNDLLLLELSLLRFSLDQIQKGGFVPISPPFLMKRDTYRGVVPLATFEDALYRVGDPKEAEGKKGFEKASDEMFLISTTEHPLIAMHGGEVLHPSKLPIKYIGISPAFRREAGAHGRDTKGIFRVHQFIQTEQIVLCRPADSWKHFDEMLNNIESIWQKLEIPHRVIEICSGDMSARDAKSCDVEAWIPSQKTYREVASCSNVTDWQSRRLDIKFDEKGERNFVHTLNATGVPSPRSLIPIIENNLNDDGTITVPDVLVPYMGKEKIGRR